MKSFPSTTNAGTSSKNNAQLTSPSQTSLNDLHRISTMSQTRKPFYQTYIEELSRKQTPRRKNEMEELQVPLGNIFKPKCLLKNPESMVQKSTTKDKNSCGMKEKVSLHFPSSLPMISAINQPKIPSCIIDDIPPTTSNFIMKSMYSEKSNVEGLQLPSRGVSKPYYLLNSSTEGKGQESCCSTTESTKLSSPRFQILETIKECCKQEDEKVLMNSSFNYPKISILLIKYSLEFLVVTDWINFLSFYQSLIILEWRRQFSTFTLLYLSISRIWSPLCHRTM